MQISVQQFLDEALASKQHVRNYYTTRERYYECHTVTRRGESWDACIEREKFVDHESNGPASVHSTEVISVTDAIFEKSRLSALPINVRVAERTFKNCSTAVSLDQNVTLTLATEKSWEVTKTQTVATEISTSVTMGADFEFFKGSGTISFKQTTTISNASREGSKSTETRTVQDMIKVPPRTVVRFRAIAYEQTIEVPYSGTLVVDATLAPNKSGLSKASQLLSEEERTMKYIGLLRLTDASKTENRVDQLDVGVECAEDHNVVHVAARNFVVPAKSLVDGFSEGFTLQANALRVETGQLQALSVLKELRNHEGMHFEVDYVAEEVRSDPARCGYDDRGSAKLAVYKVSHGTYRQCAAGKEIASYHGTEERFLRPYET